MDKNGSTQLISMHKIVDLSRLRRDSVTSAELNDTGHSHIEHFDWCQIDDKIISVVGLKQIFPTQQKDNVKPDTVSRQSSEEAEEIE